MNDEVLKKIKKEQLKILDYIIDICEKHNLQYFLIGGTLLGAVRHKGYIPWDDDLDLAMPRKDYNKFIEIFLSRDNGKFILDCECNSKFYWLPFLKIRNKNTIYQESLQKNYKGDLGIWVDIFPLDNGNNENSKFQNFQFRFVKNSRHIISIKNNIMVPSNGPTKDIICKILSWLPLRFWRLAQLKIMRFNKNDKSKYFINLGSQYGVNKQTHLKEKYYPSKKIEFEGRKLEVPNDYDYVLKKIYGNDYMKLPPIEKRITHNPMYIKFEEGEELKFDEKI